MRIRKKKWAEEIGIDWMDGMPLTEKQIKTFYDNPELHAMLKDLKKKGYLTYEYPENWKMEDGYQTKQRKKAIILLPVNCHLNFQKY